VRRGSIVQLVAIGAVCGAGAALVALLIPWLPHAASEQAGRIDFVFWFVTTICIAIFALVAAVILYSVVKFRAAPDDDSDGPPIHGHTGLEIVWTAIPAALVTAISIVSAVVLAKNEDLPHASAASPNPLRPLVVDVMAQQFFWTFKYPGFGNLTSSTLRLPIDVPVKLRITSVDVTHSFFVPEFGQKLDAVPGSVNTLAVTPDRLGTFPVICTELCGLGHALMRSQAQVMTSEKFRSWAKGGKRQPGGGVSGKALFASNGCDGCHTFKPAGATAKVGPDLDKLREEAQRAGKPLEPFIRESIQNPTAYVEPGFQPGIMPSFKTLPNDQVDALVKFLAGGQR